MDSSTPQQINQRQRKYGVNESEPEQQVQVAYRYRYPYSYNYHAPHAHYHHHHPTPTTQDRHQHQHPTPTTQDRQHHPQPQPHRHCQHNSNRNGYHYYDPASAWYHYPPHPPSSPNWHSDFEVMTDEDKPQVYQQGQGSSQSQFSPHSPSRGYSYSYPYQYKYQQPQSHSQTNNMSPLLAGEEVYMDMEPHSLFGDEYYSKGVAPVLTRARADSSPRYVDEYYTNTAPKSTPANADIDSAPAPAFQARACADSSRHVDDRYKSTAPKSPTPTHAQARVDSHSKNKDHSEAEVEDEDEDTNTASAGVGVVDGACTLGCSQFLPNSSRPQQSLPILTPTPSVARVDLERKPAAGRSSTIHESSRSRDPVSVKPPTPFFPPMASNQFTESASESESDTLQHLEPLPFMTSATATGFHSQLQLVLQNSPSPAQDVTPPKKRRRRRRGRHPLFGPELPLPTPRSDNNSTTVSSSRSSSSKSSESKHGRAWEQKIHELLDFQKKHGHCYVPQSYSPNPSLGYWVNRQRLEYKRRVDGHTSCLNDERLEQLESIGFSWAKPKGEACWEAKFKQLEEYKIEHGDCNVPTKYKQNTALGRWVSTQRSEFKKFCRGDKAGIGIDSERIRRLNSIDFVWFPLVCDVAQKHYSMSKVECKNP